MTTIKDIYPLKGRLASGHRTCSGCGIPLIARTVLAATDKPVVVANATGCLEVTTTIYPFSSWRVPYIHNAFENAAATMSGVERAYAALKKKGVMKKDVKFVVFGGDGGTYDIGLQSLSGAFERRHNFVYVCYDNEAYMNTGVQRSSATPLGAATTTTPAGKVHPGKEIERKDIAKIMVAHKIPYVATASLHNWQDLHRKAKKAFDVDGPAFLNVIQPCEEGWKYDPRLTVKLARLAVDTRFWPLYEVVNGKYKLSYRPSKFVPIDEFLKPQRRFRHLFKKENAHVLKNMQEIVEKNWEEVVRLCGEKL